MTNTVDGTFYLCAKVKSSPYRSLTARLCTRKPSLDVGEVAVELRLSLPLVLFQRPTLVATVTVPEAQAGQAVISAEVQDNIAAMLTEQLGIKVEISAS